MLQYRKIYTKTKFLKKFHFYLKNITIQTQSYPWPFPAPGWVMAFISDLIKSLILYITKIFTNLYDHALDGQVKASQLLVVTD